MDLIYPVKLEKQEGMKVVEIYGEN